MFKLKNIFNKKLNDGDKLISSVAEGDLTKISQLIAAGADVNYENRNNYTPLVTAVLNNYDKNIVSFLARAGADIHKRHDIGVNPSDYSHTESTEVYGNSIIHIFLRLRGISDHCPNNVSIDTHQADNLKHLISLGADINASNNLGQTPLMYATSEPLSLLCELGAEVNAADHFGHTALMLKAGFPDPLRALIKAGAEVNATDNEGCSVLCWSCRITESYKWQKEAVEILISNGTLVNIFPSGMFDPIDFARPETAQILIDNGYDMFKQNEEGENYLFQVRSLDAARVLIKNGADVNHQRKDGSTPLMTNVYQPEVLELLIKSKAKVNLQNEFNSTALLEACFALSSKSVKLLLDAGAKQNCKNKRGWRPAYAALMGLEKRLDDEFSTEESRRFVSKLKTEEKDKIIEMLDSH